MSLFALTKREQYSKALHNFGQDKSTETRAKSGIYTKKQPEMKQKQTANEAFLLACETI